MKVFRNILRICIVSLLPFATVSCSRPVHGPVDERAALLGGRYGDPRGSSGSSESGDRKMHGSISVGTGVGAARGNYGMGSAYVDMPPIGGAHLGLGAATAHYGN